MKTIYIVAIVLALTTMGCMKVPSDLHVFVSETGCTSQGVCPWADGTTRNFYDATQHEIVVAPRQSLKVLAHEACHAHQQVTVIDETGQDVAPLTSTSLPDLHEWLTTREAAAYAVVVGEAGPAPWGDHGITLLEDFAESCARHLVSGTVELKARFPNEPTRDEWFTERDFR